MTQYVRFGYWVPGYCVGDIFPEVPAQINTSVDVIGFALSSSLLNLSEGDLKNEFIQGVTVRISTKIAALTNNMATDPGSLVLKIRAPDAALTTLIYNTDVGLVKDGIGSYYADIVLDKFGTWRWRWEASNPNSGIAEGEITVKASRVL